MQYAWAIAKFDSTEFLHKMRSRHEASTCLRFRALQHFERTKMAAHDKNQYRPQSLQEPSSRPSERRERQNMAAHDKNQHRPRRLKERSSGQIEQRERQNMATHDKNQHRPRRLQDSTFVAHQLMTRRMLTLKLLLVRWDRMLTWQQKQDHAQRRRLEVWRQKRMREEERLKKETQKCKQRKFSGFMEVIFFLVKMFWKKQSSVVLWRTSSGFDSAAWYLFVPFASHQKSLHPNYSAGLCRTLRELLNPRHIKHDLQHDRSLAAIE